MEDKNITYKKELKNSINGTIVFFLYYIMVNLQALPLLMLGINPPSLTVNKQKSSLSLMKSSFFIILYLRTYSYVWYNINI